MSENRSVYLFPRGEFENIGWTILYGSMREITWFIKFYDSKSDGFINMQMM